MDRRLFLAATVAVAIPLSLAFAARADAPAAKTVLLIGGGPNPQYNQVAIENNVRYVDSLLMSSMSKTVLFADGRTDTDTVQYLVPPADNEQAIDFLFNGGPMTMRHSDPGLRYRATRLKQVDGPTTRSRIGEAFDKVASSPAAPTLVYFTGHGSPSRNFDANSYDLWRETGFTPRALATEIAKLPPGAPVTVVMVQCFSGGFGNILFEGAKADGDLIDRPVCGFFAATRERTAAGCTPEVNEAEYRDFTSYFFAALTGKDRVGRKVAPPDYNRDGRVGMDEACAYALINDPSIDVPVATSDVFLRRFVPMERDDDAAAVPYDDIYKWASPAQRAALDGLCTALGAKASGADRVKVALAEFRRRAAGEDSSPVNFDRRIVSEIGKWRDKMAERFPDLRSRTGETYRKGARDAAAYLQSHSDDKAAIQRLSEAMDAAQKQALDDEVTGARWLRLVRLSKSIVLEHQLRERGDSALIARFDALKALEAQNPLTP